MASPPLSPEWRALADRVVAEYRASIGDDLVAIALFGSVARGQARPGSDLDLYVVTRRPSLGDSRLHGIWDRIDASAEYQVLVKAGYRPTPSPVPYTVDDLVRAKIRSPAFYQETVVTGTQARDWVERVEQALQFGEGLLRGLRKAQYERQACG
jgi:hypothetical protein